MSATASTSIYSSLPLVDDGDCFRLLTINPSDRPYSPLACTLCLARFSTNPQYEAVSYSWGDPTFTETVTVNFQPKTVTPSLHDALRALRLAEEPRVVWVDGLCIDQDNDAAEKNFQVPLMRFIYSKCTKCIVWLGNGDDNSRRAMRVITQRQIWSKLRTRKRDGDYPREMNYLVRKPVFRRIWVVQEIALAPHVIIQCGTNIISWDQLIGIVSKMSTVGALVDFQDGKKEAGHLHPSFYPRMLESTRQRIQAGKKLELHEALRSFRPFAATLLVDKIFGLLGLLDKPDIVEVDYNKPVRDVFQDCTLATMRQSKTCEVFLCCIQMNPERRLSGLASWIPDWSDSDMSFGKPLESAQTVEIFAASAGTELGDLFLPERGCLKMRGVHICDIAELAQPIPILEDIRTRYRPTGRYVPRRTVLNFFSEIVTIFQSWKEVLQKACPSGAYHTGEPFLEAFWNTLNAGQPLFASAEEYEVWRKWISSMELQVAVMCWFVKNVVNRAPWYFVWIVMGPCMVLASFYFAFLAVLGKIALDAPTEQPDLSWQSWVPGRTTNGLIGLFPYPALVSGDSIPSLPGDSIVLFEGGTRPFVLRQRGDKWRLIGDAYIHGIMFGGAYNEVECTDIYLI